MKNDLQKTTGLSSDFVAKNHKILNIGLRASKMGPRASKVTENRDFDVPKLLKIMIFSIPKIRKNRNFDIPKLSTIMIFMPIIQKSAFCKSSNLIGNYFLSELKRSYKSAQVGGVWGGEAPPTHVLIIKRYKNRECYVSIDETCRRYLISFDSIRQQCQTYRCYFISYNSKAMSNILFLFRFTRYNQRAMSKHIVNYFIQF